jgi:hypothetical protein
MPTTSIGRSAEAQKSLPLPKTAATADAGARTLRRPVGIGDEVLPIASLVSAGTEGQGTAGIIGGSPSGPYQQAGKLIGEKSGVNSAVERPTTLTTTGLRTEDRIGLVVPPEDSVATVGIGRRIQALSGQITDFALQVNLRGQKGQPSQPVYIGFSETDSGKRGRIITTTDPGLIAEEQRRLWKASVGPQSPVWACSYGNVVSHPLDVYRDYHIEDERAPDGRVVPYLNLIDDGFPFLQGPLFAFIERMRGRPVLLEMPYFRMGRTGDTSNMYYRYAVLLEDQHVPDTMHLILLDHPRANSDVAASYLLTDIAKAGFDHLDAKGMIPPGAWEQVTGSDTYRRTRRPFNSLVPLAYLMHEGFTRKEYPIGRRGVDRAITKVHEAWGDVNPVVAATAEKMADFTLQSGARLQTEPQSQVLPKVEAKPQVAAPAKVKTLQVPAKKVTGEVLPPEKKPLRTYNELKTDFTKLQYGEPLPEAKKAILNIVLQAIQFSEDCVEMRTAVDLLNHILHHLDEADITASVDDTVFRVEGKYHFGDTTSQKIASAATVAYKQIIHSYVEGYTKTYELQNFAKAIKWELFAPKYYDGEHSSAGPVVFALRRAIDAIAKKNREYSPNIFNWVAEGIPGYVMDWRINLDDENNRRTISIRDVFQENIPQNGPRATRVKDNVGYYES